jgi:hypothetical protein
MRTLVMRASPVTADMDCPVDPPIKSGEGNDGFFILVMLGLGPSIQEPRS